MKLDFKQIGIGAGLATAAGLGGYAIFALLPTKPKAEAPAVVAASAAPVSKNAAMPINHPPVPATGQVAPIEREGKVEVDRLAKFVHFRTGSRNVKDLLVDGKVLWVATSGGLIRYDTANEKFRLFDNQNGLLSNGMFHVGKLGSRIVVGTYGGGMSLYDEAKEAWETYNVPEGLGDAFVYDVLEASNGDIWIATWSGVNRVRKGALRDRSKWDVFTVANTKGGLPNDWVYGLAEGKNGDIWLATEGGLGRFAGEKWDNWNHAKGLGAPYEKVKNDISFKSDPAQVSSHHAKQKQEMGLTGIKVAFNPNYIISLAVDAEGVVWAGTWGGGLSRFDGKTWIHYTTTEGLPGNHVFMLHMDAKKTLWVGTNNGLARFQN
ncbi:MAG: two-component regulator propeller domain-containing protein, partial [Usitatibacteraceae bacterium]